MAKRTFDELSVLVTGVQSFEQRFGKRRRYDYEKDVPAISQWRANLTGLSQERNLYFVACAADIYVYEPQYPTQAISSEPSLIIPSQPSQSQLPGCLDQLNPHTVNYLLVQHLGDDEIVATVRDDGDVDAVLIRHVIQAIERRAGPESSLGVLADEVRPIFHRNVGASAWGLAIHSQARVLATSSNGHEVRIFKFGLLRGEESLAGDGSFDATLAAGEDSGTSAAILEPLPAAARTSESNAEQRHSDVTQTVLNGDTNIPYISFCNTGDDPHARWLLTTDIGGYCRIMDLHKTHAAEVAVQQFRFGRSYPGSSFGFDRHNAGWAIMFLDTRSFLSETDFESAVALDEGDTLPGVKSNQMIWDLSDTVGKVPENAPIFMFERPKRRRPGDRTQSESPQQNDEDPSADDISMTNEDTEVQHNAEDAVVEEPTAEALVDAEELPSLSSSSQSEESDDEQYEHDDIGDGMHLLVDEDSNDEGTEDTTSFSALYGGRRIFGNLPYFYQQNGLCDDLPCPILHASVKNVYLLQPSKHQYGTGTFAPPMVGLANPLRQAIQSQLGYLNTIDRLNMNAYIPALGVLVLASQKGRAVVLSLTKLQASARYPPEIREYKNKTNYAMRVEKILPLAGQEARSERPFAPLHGIAASPLQGAGSKRCRLMMMYQDHTVLSYELSRGITCGSGVDVDGMIV